MRRKLPIFGLERAASLVRTLRCAPWAAAFPSTFGLPVRSRTQELTGKGVVDIRIGLFHATLTKGGGFSRLRRPTSAKKLLMAGESFLVRTKPSLR
jgi:hypothetical protein